MDRGVHIQTTRVQQAQVIFFAIGFRHCGTLRVVCISSPITHYPLPLPTNTKDTINNKQ